MPIPVINEGEWVMRHSVNRMVLLLWMGVLIYIISLFLRQMIHNKEDQLNGLVYMTPLKQEPTRYEMVRFSTWRIYLFQ